MPKEKSYNPVQAQRKADKAREVKKGKAEAKGRRDEKLARKNPDRLQKQIDDLRSVAERGGKLSKHEQQVLEGLERELAAVRKAREALGDNAPSFSHPPSFPPSSSSSSAFPPSSSYSTGQKRPRRRFDGAGSDSDSLGDAEDVPEDVRRIPMPRDTPPPIPKPEMDQWWARRRARRDAARQSHNGSAASAANAVSISGKRGGENFGGTGSRGDADGERGNRGGDGGDTAKRAKAEESRTVYEAKPIVRDLRKEAVAAFVPTAVQMKMSKGKGQGGLLEPEEADRLEREGYMRSGRSGGLGDDGPRSRRVTVEDAEEEGGH